MSLPTDRLAHLRAYLAQLARDLKQRGAFRPDEESIEAYALAVLEGSTAIGAQLWADLKTVGKQGLAVAEPLAVGLLENLGGHLVGRVVDYAASHLDGRAERKAAGKRIMEGAANLGKRRGGRP